MKKSPKKLVIGENCAINNGNYFHSEGGINIGDNVIFSAYSRVLSYGLIVTKLMDETLEHEGKSVNIGDWVWLGVGSTILPGVTIADHVVIAAGSVVTRDCLDSYCVYGGVPAKKIKDYR